MEFGRVPNLAGIDLSLPPDAFDPVALWGGRRVADPKVYVGAPSYGVKSWVGRLYPPGTRPAEYLAAYSRQYPALEHSGTRFVAATAAQAAAWARQTPAGFRFCPKFPEEITHTHKLLKCEALTEQFLEGLAGYGDKLGTCLLLPDPGIGVREAASLYAYLRLLGSRVPYALELRHASWYDHPTALEALRAFLAEQGQTLALTDTPGRRDAAHMIATSGTVFIRVVCNARPESDEPRLDAWARRMARWVDQGAQTVYVFLHTPDGLTFPEAGAYLLARLAEETRLPLPQPQVFSDLFG